MARRARTETLQRWSRFLDSLAEGRGEIPELEQHRARLKEMDERARQLDLERGAHAAAKQAATQEINEILENGQKIVTLMRFWLQEHHGNRNEKLIEFGVKPFRSRPRKKTPPQE